VTLISRRSRHTSCSRHARVECKIHICININCSSADHFNPALVVAAAAGREKFCPVREKIARSFAAAAAAGAHTQQIDFFRCILRFGARPNNKTPTTTMPFADKTRSLCVGKFLLATLNVCTNDSCCRVRRETVIRACSWFSVFDVSRDGPALSASIGAGRSPNTLTHEINVIKREQVHYKRCGLPFFKGKVTRVIIFKTNFFLVLNFTVLC
jgi:hypothetical protein